MRCGRAHVVGLLTLVAITGCGVHTQSSPTVLDDADVRVVGQAPPSTGSPGTPTDRAELCFVSGDRLVTIVRVLPVPLSAHRALEELDDLTRSGLPVGIRSAIRDGDIAAADDAAAARGIARVDLSAEFVQNPSSDQVLALAQTVCTLTSIPGVGQIQFTVNGDPVEIPRGDGSVTDDPVSRFDYRNLIPT